MQAFFCRVKDNDFNPCAFALASDSRTLRECFPSAEFQNTEHFRMNSISSRLTYELFMRNDGKRKVLLASDYYTHFAFSRNYTVFIVSERFFKFYAVLSGVKLI